jgi:cytochrome c oxidase subunit II
MSLLLVAMVVLIFVVIFQIAKASEYVSVLKGEEKSRLQNNKINAFLLISFLILGLIGCWWCNELYAKKTLFVHGSASEEGKAIDSMFMVTLWITGIVFLLTQVALFYFSFKYQENPNRKAFFLPHNNKLEVIWTVIPAITLTVLVVIGLKEWFKITGDAPKNAMVVEVTGKQFAWIYRYPGADGKFGKKNYKLTNDAAQNVLGQDFDDAYNHDDVVSTQALYIVKGRPVKMVINSRDVIHDVGLNHFRLKMDAVPGIPTTQWFTPNRTTEEMRKETGNPNFEYEISCDQMCGPNHFAMRGVIKVVTQEEFDMWVKTQEPYYYTVHPEKKPAPPVVDSTAGKTAITPAAAANNKTRSK